MEELLALSGKRTDRAVGLQLELTLGLSPRYLPEWPQKQ